MNTTGDLNAREPGTKRLTYATGYHAPVLCNAVLQGLITSTEGVYVDGTLGGGGHTAAMLDALGPKGRVIAIDRDDDAIAEASSRLAAELESGRESVAFIDSSKLATKYENVSPPCLFISSPVFPHCQCLLSEEERFKFRYVHALKRRQTKPGMSLLCILKAGHWKWMTKVSFAQRN